MQENEGWKGGELAVKLASKMQVSEGWIELSRDVFLPRVAQGEVSEVGEGLVWEERP